MYRFRRTKKSILIILALTISVVLGVIIGNVSYAYSVINKMDTVEINEDNLGISEHVQEQMLAEEGTIKNIALFGVDAVDGARGRSDTVMIATIDTVHKKLKLTSIMRDSYVSIPGRNNDKLNHAYAYGGAELSMKTLNENFDLNIDDFASVNFTTLPKIVDKLGGVVIDVDSEELKYINGYIDSLNSVNGTSSANLTEPGEQRLDGTQTMAYCRIRYTEGGDFKRTERNREVLIKLFEKLSATPSNQLPQVLDEILPLVQTSLKPFDILALGKSIIQIRDDIQVNQERIPLDGFCEDKMINGVYYLTFDKDITVQKIHDYIFESTDEGV